MKQRPGLRREARWRGSGDMAKPAPAWEKVKFNHHATGVSCKDEDVYGRHDFEERDMKPNLQTPLLKLTRTHCCFSPLTVCSSDLW